ncbi:VanZ family protein [Phycicoccus sp.]|uniref:VanZ family protein n=1 Tax=Phycicoccus sp. TaxID=1902410 RepID=UPI002BEF4CBA|nr:VanZ family protein [Phycicoccus sp.]HMM93941.1 VanZ family protein [Phycicoccus sp.]
MRRAPWAARTALVLAALATVGQAVVLYAPDAPGASPFPGSDKVVHLAVFLVPVALALRAGLPVRWVVGLFAAHALLSEVVQATLLPHRSGDPLDAVADLVGVVLAVLAHRLRPGPRPSAVAGRRATRW